MCKSEVRGESQYMADKKMDLLGMAFPSVKRAESLATKQEVNKSARCFLCKDASSCSNSS